MSLKKFPFALFILFLTCLKNEISAQELGLQINAGLMNYGGDLQPKSYTFSEAKLTAGIGIRYEIKRFALRAGINYGSVQGDDKLTRNKNRNLNFKSAIAEGSLCLELNLFPVESDNKFNPYIFGGIGAYHYNPYTTYNSQKVFLRPLSTEGEGLSVYPQRKVYSLTEFENPFGIGVKYKLSSNLLIGVEFNSRLLYTDYLDDVSRKYPNQNDLFKERGQLAVDLSFRGNELDPTSPFPSEKTRGNPAHNDNYYTSVITLTYIFPGNNFFGNSFGHSRHSISCPKKVY
jgi:uncharacterized protein DUF6089